MPIIDLDHHAQIVLSRPSPRRLPILLALAVGSLLFGPTGEPQGSAGPVDEATACSSSGAFRASNGETTTVFDAQGREIQRIPHCLG
ncbi:hypothetical protein ACIA5C_47765 [Actinoplanes sp. NPDC051343]|uniref:hypothetical protein n=1 Tax=Actinoplanes sp. NPDC051343 TaxID=3363906 RepID=UPI0037902BD5